jgi:acylphosphatase
MPEIIARHLTITGRVQGVGYRYSLHKQAQALGVLGWCKNLTNGSVEVHVQGPEPAVTEIVGWCYDGPPHAVVSAIEVREETPDNSLQAFEVRR